MAIIKKCSKCGEKYEYGKKCSCYYKNRKKDSAIKGKKDTFYSDEPWRTLRNIKMIEYGAHCQRCILKFHRITTTHLEGHHIIPRSKRPDLELDPDNIVILCKRCNLQLGDSGIIDWDRTKEKRTNMDYQL